MVVTDASFLVIRAPFHPCAQSGSGGHPCHGAEDQTLDRFVGAMIEGARQHTNRRRERRAS
jgi:hypothetical protein